MRGRRSIIDFVLRHPRRRNRSTRKESSDANTTVAGTLSSSSDSYEHDDDDVFESLASRQEWSACLALLADSSTTATHTLLTHGAPLSVIDQCLHVLSSSPSDDNVPLEARDALGRTPLHVAVTVGCTVEVVDRLLQGNHMPVFLRDNAGCTALHTACRSVWTSRRQQWQQQQHVVQFLVHTDPEGIYARNDAGQRPVDISLAHTQRYVRVRVPWVEENEPQQILTCHHPDNDTVSALGCVDIQDGVDPFEGMEEMVVDDDNDDDASLVADAVEASCHAKVPAAEPTTTREPVLLFVGGQVEL